MWLCSCTHYYYVPNVQNVPLFKEKNEFRLSGALGAGDVSGSIDLQTAFSISDHIGMMTNYMYAHGEDKSNNNWGKGSYFEGAVGYFKPFSEYLVFEIYGGLGGCKQNHQYYSFSFPGPGTYTGTSELSFSKLFIQPSLGVIFKGFDFAISTRLCNLSFNKTDNQINRQTDESEYNNLNSIAQNKRYMFLEPALTIRGGSKNIKVQVQAAFSSYSKYSDLYFEKSHISIGLYFNIVQKPGEILVY